MGKSSSSVVKPVKRLNRKEPVSPKPSAILNKTPTRRSPRLNTPVAVSPSPLKVARRARSCTAFKSFLNKCRREQPGKLRAEVVSIWRKMSAEEKKAFQRISTVQVQETPSIRVHFLEEEVPAPVSNDDIDIEPMELEPIVSPPRPERNTSIFRSFLNAINRALRIFF
ncbi:uncharacterized protein LOC116801948 [Drosophila sechellia]|uniref:uncharacterized protein LOC116801948 n=1 Tax=Drosophila sechellia TaxID=7238 RepID=UPI0013DD9E9C|nr:uncharacterized protein LOC116801948 [Drosophila sechellia]